jgi:SRSO17 transposase
MVMLRLFIPENWTSDSVRLKYAGGVPIEHRTARSKPEIALAEIDRVIAAGVRFDCVLADAGYGSSAPFRPGLIAVKLNRSVHDIKTRDARCGNSSTAAPRACVPALSKPKRSGFPWCPIGKIMGHSTGRSE